jgi:hypothetical protein
MYNPTRFDPNTIRRAFTTHADDNNVHVWNICPEQIHREAFCGPVGGITLHFVTKVKKAMIDELLRESFRRLSVEHGRDLRDILPAQVAEDIFGTQLCYMTQEARGEVESAIEGVWYDMMIEDAVGRRVSVLSEVS